MEQLYHILTKHPRLRRRVFRVIGLCGDFVCISDVEQGGRFRVRRDDLLAIPKPKGKGAPGAEEV